MKWYIRTPDGAIHRAEECKVVAMEPTSGREHTEAEAQRAFNGERFSARDAFASWWLSMPPDALMARRLVADPAPAGNEDRDELRGQP